MNTSENQPIDDLGIIIAAGGASRRYGESNKLFERLGNIPVFVYSLRNYAPLCRPENLVLVAPEADMQEFSTLTAEFCPQIPVVFTVGGATRCHSVYNGLTTLPDSVRYVAVHDAARPFASAELLLRCLAAARQCDGALAAHPVTDTLKKATPSQTVSATIDRSALWAVETPQIFALNALKAAYEKAFATGQDFTDDAGIMEQAGARLKLVRNPDNNLKITYPGDLCLAEALLVRKV